MWRVVHYISGTFNVSGQDNQCIFNLKWMITLFTCFKNECGAQDSLLAFLVLQRSLYLLHNSHLLWWSQKYLLLRRYETELSISMIPNIWHNSPLLVTLIIFNSNNFCCFTLFNPSEAKGITEEDAQNALKAFVGKKLCFGKRPAEEMEIKDVSHSSAVHVSIQNKWLWNRQYLNK